MQKMGIWRAYLIEVLADRDEAIGYLQAILDDYYIYGSHTVILRALETVIEAQGGVSELAKRADMEPQAFSEMLSNKETPLIDALVPFSRHSVINSQLHPYKTKTGILAPILGKHL